MAAAAQQSALITAIDDDGSYYPIDKLDAHRRNIHHVAISVFVFCDDRLLLQRRALDKYHSGGLWANTCCSHPMPDETADACANRRLTQELGISVALKGFHTIRYTAQVGALFENETAHCFYGYWDSNQRLPKPNPQEVSDTRWMTFDEIVKDIDSDSNNYSAWFKIYVNDHRDNLLSMPWSQLGEHG